MRAEAECRGATAERHRSPQELVQPVAARGATTGVAAGAATAAAGRGRRFGVTIRTVTGARPEGPAVGAATAEAAPWGGCEISRTATGVAAARAAGAGVQGSRII